MTKSYVLISLMMLITSSSCDSTKKINAIGNDTSLLELTYLEGYFSRNDIAFDSEIKHIVVTGQADFDNFFGIAKTMDNTIFEIDFQKENIAAVILRPSYKSQILLFCLLK